MKIKTLAAALLALTALQSHATVIDFNQVVGFQTLPSPYQEDGFTITNSSPYSSAMLFWGTMSYNADPRGNTYSHNYGSTTSTLTRTGGGSFTFNSIDLTDVYNYGSGGSVVFDFLDTNNTLTHSTVNLPTVVGLHTFTFDIANLTSVSWTPVGTQGNWIQVDNIVVDSAQAPTNRVPEPASMALVGLGVAMMGALRRRQAA